MKKAKKILALLLCAVLLVGATVAGTVAYLTSQDTVTNTFTVGNVTIELNENDYDNDGNTKQNDYSGVIPGSSYEKEPVVTVKAGSADCYVRAKVTVTVPGWTETDQFEQFANSFASNFILNDSTVAGFNTQDWTASDPSIKDGTINTGTKTIVYYLYYRNSGTNNIVESPKADYDLPALFHDIYIPSDLNNTTLSYLDGMTINVEAHAIQSSNFEATEGKTAELNAWDAFDRQGS